MLAAMSGNRIVEKIRYKVEANGMIWDVDEFLGDNAGLVMAEIELTDESQQIVLPGWAGDEVTGDKRYYNSSLAEIPFSKW
jgi:adenylate cyclase